MNHAIRPSPQSRVNCLGARDVDWTRGDDDVKRGDKRFLKKEVSL